MNQRDKIELRYPGINIIATLRDWKIIDWDPSSYIIRGDIHDDRNARFFDGETIRTSRLQRVDFELGVAFTLNSAYMLEEQ